MSELVASGQVFELIAVLLLLEGIALSAFRALTGRGIGHADLWLSLAAGAGLLLAARGIAVQAAWPWIALALLLALAGHAGDLRRRWRN